MLEQIHFLLELKIKSSENLYYCAKTYEIDSEIIFKRKKNFARAKAKLLEQKFCSSQKIFPCSSKKKYFFARVKILAEHARIKYF
jgi:hypothetical protein